LGDSLAQDGEEVGGLSHCFEVSHCRKLVVYVTHDIREAVLLSDRVLVMSGHPGTIREEIPVPLGRPRELAGLDRPEAARAMRRIWEILEDEVRSTLRG
jgi:NitT/TauT family transport system ATP-binding protein